MSKISNILLMLQYLENGRKYNIKELAEKLEVSERMIRVYKEELEKAGIYIDTIMGPYGGYVLTGSTKIPSRRFKKEDYDFLKSISLPKETKEKLDIIADKVYGSYLDSINTKIELKEEVKTTYNVIARAIKEKRKVKINYSSTTDGKLDRIIRPYDIFLYTDGWVCAAHCEVRNHLRSFELNKINKIELLDEYY